MSDIGDRLSALEEAVAHLLDERAGRDHTRTTPEGAAADVAGEFWAVDELGRRAPDGAVLLAGHLQTHRGPVRWQWGRTSDDLLESEWEACATGLAALGHPVRLRLLRLILGGTTATSDLAQDEHLGTTGQLHHHLRTLVAAGWLTSTGRGRYDVPPHRVVPLLAVVSASLPY